MTKTIFDINETQMSETKSTYTLTEIYQQPATWKKTCQQVASMKDELKAFIDQVITQDDFDVILTGAGTSEFVGNTLFSYLNKKLNYKAKSYGTTDLVATPENYLSRTKPTLLISFGRSGNSPESVGAIDVAEEVCDNLYHLFVTCNKNGALSKKAADSDNCFAINLTDETHDQSFAMTSSFSNMYLATFLAFNLDNLDESIAKVEKIATAGQNFLDNQYTMAKDIVDGYNFKRIVYLGSNALKGISQESALKMLELTAGEVVTMYDTPLGFRHGPKSIVDDDTLTVVYISDNEYSRQYEIDLIKEMSGQRKGNKIVAVMNGECEEIKELVDYVITFDIDGKFDNILLGFDYIIAAQVIAVLKSLSMGKTPDNPCPTGEVNRVVKGVTLYPYSKGE
ncbi:MAG: SIS domain-containing protein [Thomasclavelia sp.]|uniref:SIS domain-containing protein n=1 Tax=Thomasclavelia sp. TaxID=3025757 RepID=UPI0039A20978